MNGIWYVAWGSAILHFQSQPSPPVENFAFKLPKI